MTTAVGTFGWLLLALVTAVSPDSSHCGVDRRLTPSDDVLAGMNTPVYFYRTNKSAELGYTLSPQEDAMVNFKKQSRFFKDFKNEGAGIIDKCRKSNEWLREINSPIECKAPDTAYPKIVVFVGWSIYSDYKERYTRNHLTALLEFVLAFWNTVDRQFRNLQHPKMRLNIAGIIVEKHPGGALYRCSGLGDDGCDSQFAVDTLADFMNTNGSSWSQYFGSYNIFTFMTTMPLYTEEIDGYVETPGSERSRLMCSERKKGPPTVIMFSYRTRLVATRQLSWLIQKGIKSSIADGSACASGASAPEYLQKPYTDHLPLWSKCLLDSFTKRFNTRQAKCFFDKPKIGSPLPRILLGQALSMDEQCFPQNRGECDEGEDICQILECKNDGFFRFLQRSCIKNKHGAADGTSCGKGKICLAGKCVFKADME